MEGKSASRWTLLAALLAMLLLAACQGGGQQKAWLYVSLPLHGPSPNTISMGDSIRRGVELAFEEVGNQVGNTQIELQVLDDGNETGQWRSDKESENAQKVVADEQAVAYIGPYNSGAAMVSIPILNRAGMLQISPSAT
jgi:branched-chain amino acid transport system substrate-binding protein